MRRGNLKIVNETHWKTSDLRDFATAGLKACGAWEEESYYEVRFAYARRGGPCGGHGYYNCPSMMIALPKHVNGKLVDELPEKVVLNAGGVLEHERGHNVGLRHGEMHEDLLYASWRATPDTVAWAVDLVIGRKGANKEPADITAVRSAKVDGKITEIERKLQSLQSREKRLKKRLTHWKTKQRYYAKKAANPSG